MAALPSLLRRIVTSVSILSVSKVLRISLGFVISAYVARSLGAEKFGELAYAFAIVSFAQIACSLGFESILRRELNQKPNSVNELVGTALFSQLVAGILGAIAIGIASFSLRSGDSALTLLFASFSLLAVWNAVLSNFFQNALVSHPVAIAQLASFAAIAALKLYLVASAAPVWAFAAAESLDAILVALLLAYFYNRSRGLIKLRWRFAWLKRLLRDSWPAALSGFVVIVYMRTDQVMLKAMVGAEAVGIYSAAVRFCEIWAFIPAFIAASYLPTLIASKTKSPEQYSRTYGGFLEANFALALIIAAAILILAPEIITLFLGSEYSDSISIVRIHVCTLILIFIGVSRSQHFLIENLLQYTLWISLLGVAVNVSLNLYLIERYNAAGAAWATAISQAIVVLGGPFLFSSTRPFGIFVLKSLTFPRFVNGIRSRFL